MGWFQLCVGLFSLLSAHWMQLEAETQIDKEASVRIGIAISKQFVGDREVAWRIKIAGERLGWSVIVDERGGYDIKNSHLDWTICMLPYRHFFNPFCPNYLMVFHPIHYLNKAREFKIQYHKYDGYLLTINDRENLQNGLKKKRKDFHFIPFYPTVFSHPYQKLALNNLMVMVPVWGNRNRDPKFKLLHHLLSQTGFAKFYGVQPNEDVIVDGYMGPIPFDGSSVIDVLQQNGIVLILHSNIHNADEIPSARIFEAAAASAVVICDENTFVKKHFGDSVFYIDTSLSAEEIFHQIQAHLEEIGQNPEKALEMARKAHEIFIENFTMESQLLELQRMHNRIKSEKKTTFKKQRKKRGAVGFK